MNATAARPELDTRLTRAELRSRWQRTQHDPVLRDVPGKIELNEKGTIELSPPNTRHAMLQAFVIGELQRLRPDGTALGECSIETDIGIRVPDASWASAEFMSRYGATSPLPKAPELCVEVLSPTNSRPELREKIAAYLAAGAIEVWLVAEDGTVEMFGESGCVDVSSLGMALGRPPP